MKKVSQRKTLKVAKGKSVSKKPALRKLSASSKAKTTRKVASIATKKKASVKRASPAKRKFVARGAKVTKRKVVAKKAAPKRNVIAKKTAPKLNTNLKKVLPKRKVASKTKLKTKPATSVKKLKTAKVAQHKGSFKSASKTTKVAPKSYDKNLSIQELFQAIHDEVVKERQGLKNLEPQDHHMHDHVTANKHGLQTQQIPRTAHRSRGR